MKKIFFILSLLGIILSSGCEESESEVLVFIENPEDIYHVKGGETHEIKINTFTNKGKLKQLTLTSYDTESGVQVLLDTTLHVSACKFSYMYTVPPFKSDSIIQHLRLSTSNEDNRTQEYTLPIIIKGGDRLLTEYSGIMLYAGNSGKECALSFSHPTQPFIFEMADSTTILPDIYAYYEDRDTSMRLSREWRSASNALFVRHNSFDYAKATSRSIQTTYNNSVRVSHLTDIDNGDIILVGHEETAWGAFRVVMTYDAEGTRNDGYLLNLKIADGK